MGAHTNPFKWTKWKRMFTQLNSNDWFGCNQRNRIFLLYSFVYTSCVSHTMYSRQTPQSPQASKRVDRQTTGRRRLYYVRIRIQNELVFCFSFQLLLYYFVYNRTQLNIFLLENGFYGRAWVFIIICSKPLWIRNEWNDVIISPKREKKRRVKTNANNMV